MIFCRSKTARLCLEDWKKTVLLVIAAASVMFYGCGNEKNDSKLGRLMAISAVNVEKRSVCMNEDVEISVKAETGNGPDSNLKYYVGDQAGNPVVLRFDTPGEKKVPVIVKDMVYKTTSHTTFEVTVKECECSSLTITATPVNNSADIIHFTVEGAEDMGDDLSYKWDFGDGTREKTLAPAVTHDYRGRNLKRFESSFVVKVTASQLLSRRSGRMTVSLNNVNYISALMGNPSIPVRYNRFPEVHEDSYTLQVAMNNIYEYPVEFNEAELVITPNDRSLPSQTLVVTAEEILDDTMLPADTEVTRTLRLAKSLVSQTSCTITAVFTGTWENDSTIRAKVRISITPQNEELAGSVSGTGPYSTVKNQLLIDRLNRASEIIKGRPITPDDILQLEKEGKI
ncbi:MAG: PKD domain-containing protein [Spirochaetes bacterium]|nr:PKD domain-containing protein [Spirochaetota bacterium]